MSSYICYDSRIKILNDSIKKITEKMDSIESHENEWFELAQDRKSLYRNKLLLEQERGLLIPEKLRKFEEKVNNLKVENRNIRKDYENKTEITPKNIWRSISIMAAWSGLTPDAIKEFINAENAKCDELTIAVRNVWGALPLRSDKSLVSIDLEVAAPLLYGSVDMGVASSIIEVGYIKVAPNGEIFHDGYLCGVEKDYAVTIGTGAVEVHNITMEMVKGLKTFSENRSKQDELLNVLDGSIMIAHNAQYEISQLSSSLPGFAKLLKERRIEVIDTKYLVKHLIGGIKTNTNEAFVEVTGGKYEGAHRALDDALMTLNALMRNKNLPEITL